MNENKKKTQRFFLVLPLLVTPFLAITFWLMGGGVVVPQVSHKSGLNMSLPDAINTKDSSRDKMSFYELANADSAKRKEQLRNDPNFHAKKVEEKSLVQEIPEPDQTKYNFASKTKKTRLAVPAMSIKEGNTDRLPDEATKREVDPDIEAINQTLDKLASLQHPTKTPERSATEILKESLAIGSLAEHDDSYFGKTMLSSSGKRFLNEKTELTKTVTPFKAFVPVEQVLQNGSVLKLHLKQPITVNGEVIPSGTTVYGTVNIENGRMFVLINSILYRNIVYPVSLSVYDMDGIEGIHVPGSIAVEVVKSATDQSLQSVNVLSLDPSIKTQALSAGVGIAKNILSKKVKTLRATITAGYEVLLKDNKAK